MRDVSISGNAQERAQGLAESSADSIRRVVKLYQALYHRLQMDLAKCEEYLRDSVARLRQVPEYQELVVEVESLAKAVAVPELTLWSLIYRTELLGAHKALSLVPVGQERPTECTRVYHRPGAHAGILGQNWDWFTSMVYDAMLLRIEQPDKPRILTVTEAGIPGKIGINNAGVCLTLNIVAADLQPCPAVPLHFLLRRCLELTSVAQAVSMVQLTPLCCGSIVTIADRQDCYTIEIAGDEKVVTNDLSFTVRSNRYETSHLRSGYPISDELMQNASTRYQRALEMSKSLGEVKAVKRILRRTDGQYPICCAPAQVPIYGEVTTVCSVVMNPAINSLEVCWNPSCKESGEFADWQQFTC